ncbi:MAG: DDE-type integrase/transposase/recombinase [Promethearchaeota archaeon]|jgi:transposase InsO family protein
MSQQEQKSNKEQIALFKYGIIAPVIHDTFRKQASYFKEMSKRIFDVPGLGRKQYKWRTFKSWLRNYRLHGFESLKPKTRTDKGGSRVLDEFLKKTIIEKIEQFPYVNNASLIYRMLINDGHILNGIPCEETVRTFIKNNHLLNQDPNPVPRKKYEKPHINELWICDFLHGPKCLIERKRQRIFLCAIIDDHSRIITGSIWALFENTKTLELVLKDAILTFGLPKRFYCDNGSVFISSHLQLVCARIGIALVHSKPYDSPSRGKIERFFRTVRDTFLNLLSLNHNYSLEDLNNMFQQWLDQHYHRRMHHGIGQLPMDRYMNDLKKTNIKRMNQNEIDTFFYQTHTRLVRNDSTISFDSTFYEVPHKYIGSKIEIRHPTGNQNEIWIYENNKPVCQIKPVDPGFNSNFPQSGIRFSDQNGKEKS